jgi:hypothetical protein
MPFELSRQGRVLGPDALGDLHQRPVRVQPDDAAVGHEHGAELEADEPTDLAAHPRVRRDPLAVAQHSEPVRGEDHGRATTFTDRERRPQQRCLVVVVALRVGHVGPCDEPTLGDGCGAIEHLGDRGSSEQLHVAGVHVHCRRQPCRCSALHVRLEGCPVDTSVREEGQQDRGHAGDGATGADGGHRSCG